MTLEDRVTKLETKLTPRNIDPLYILHVIVEVGQHEPGPEPEYQHLQSGGQCWTRREDETEDVFKDRAMREVVRSNGPIVFTVNRPLARLLQTP